MRLSTFTASNLFDLVTNGAVVLDHHRLHGLDESTLDVTSFGRFHGSINQTLATAHSVEVELGRRKTGKVRVLHKT